MVSDTFDNTEDDRNTNDTTQYLHGTGVEPLRVPDPAPSHTRALSVQPESAENAPASSTDASVASIKDAIITMISMFIFVLRWRSLLMHAATENAGGDTSKFKPGNFPWTNLQFILAEQGFVVRGWPVDAPMPSEIRGGNTVRAKGISVLKRGELRTLYSAFENNDITICRVEDKAGRSKSSDRLLQSYIANFFGDSGTCKFACTCDLQCRTTCR